MFSKRDAEATHLLSFRLVGMYARLPEPMQAREVLVNNLHEFRLSNGSAALAFPTTGGRSYTGTFALVDEADYVARSAGNRDLQSLLDAVKPTIDGGGQMVLLSTVDKGAPGSTFKRIYQAAKGAGTSGVSTSGMSTSGVSENGYAPVFLPWSARPDRTVEWYEAVKRDIWARSGSLDSLYAEYPATDVEALAARSSDARFAAEWCTGADDTGTAPMTNRSQHKVTKSPGDGADNIVSSCLCVETGLPALNGLTVWESPRPGRWYVIGADPAGGNPQSDESAACVLDAVTGDQVAVWAGRFEPATFAGGLAALGRWIAAGGAQAGVLVERNNHGHAVLLALRESANSVGEGVDGIGSRAAVLRGLDGQPGWLTTAKNKALAVDAAADLLRDGSLEQRRRACAQGP